MSAYVQHPLIFLIVLLANVPILLIVLRMAYESWREVSDAFFFWLGPVWFKIVDIMRNNDAPGDQEASFKMLAFVVAFLAVVAGEYVFVTRHFPAVVAWESQISPQPAQNPSK